MKYINNKNYNYKIIIKIAMISKSNHGLPKYYRYHMKKSKN